jgi:hypothetical protein
MTVPWAQVKVIDPTGVPPIELAGGTMGTGEGGSGSGTATSPLAVALLAPGAALAIAASGEIADRRLALDITPWTTISVQANVNATGTATVLTLLMAASLGGTYAPVATVSVGATGLQEGTPVVFTPTQTGKQYFRLDTDGTVTLGDVFIVLASGAQQRTILCNAQMTGFEVWSDDLCAADTLADFSAQPIYSSTGFDGPDNSGNGGVALKNSTITTDAPWNGKQALRMQSNSDATNNIANIATHDLGAVDDFELIVRVRFPAGYFSTMALGQNFIEWYRYSEAGWLQVGVTASSDPSHPSAFHLREGWSGMEIWPTLVAIDDGNYWDIILHSVRSPDGTGNVTGDMWVRRSDGSGSTTHVGTVTSANEDMTSDHPWDQWQLSIYAPADYTKWMDLGAWGVIDSGAHPGVVQ